MTRENKGNCIIIAKFMGAKIIEKDYERIVCQFPNKSELDWWLYYDTKWDWLMPCIAKITNECKQPEKLNNLKDALLANDINNAYKFVVNYLTNFNK